MYYNDKLVMVAWRKVCQPKSIRGLGFRDVFAWNLASMGRYVWEIAAKKDSPWVKWINSVYLKEQDWWHYTPRVETSWYWKSDQSNSKC